MFLKIILILAAIVAVLAVVIATRPDDFRVTRTATLPVLPSAVFQQVNDLTRWNSWSPWARLDPNCKNTLEGPPSGVGASFAWSGNNEVGEGRMTITESRPAELVRMDLEFIRPFAGRNQTEFTFQPEGEGTRMSWTMTGKNNFLSKAMGLLMNCDKMVGGQFEQGFENLKAVLASKAPQS